MPRRIKPKISPRALKVEKLRRICMSDFTTFVKYLWPCLSGDDLIWEPHHEAFCLHLEAVLDGTINTLGCSVCPGSTKTTIFVILWPIWCWLHKPWWKFITATHSLELSYKSNVGRRKVLESDRFRQLFATDWSLDEVTKGLITNTAGGEFRSTAVGARVTGNHAHVIILDDLLTPSQALTTERTKHLDFYTDELDSRRVPGQPDRTVGVMQRLYSGDIIGHLEELGYWDAMLSLACEYDPALDTGPTCLGWSDWRTEPGEPLSETMYPAQKRAMMKRSPRLWATQYQQQPSGGDSSMINVDWFVRDDLPTEYDLMWTAWDLTFGDGADSDETCGVLFGLKDGQTYVVDVVHGQMHFLQQLDAIEKMASQHPVSWNLIEKKANGAAAIITLRRNAAHRKIRGGLIAWASSTKKELRIAAATGFIEGGLISLPKDGKAAWLPAFLAQADAYPLVKNDDIMDAFSIGVLAAEARIMAARKKPTPKGGGGGGGSSTGSMRPSVGDVQQTIGGRKFGGVGGKKW